MVDRHTPFPHCRQAAGKAHALVRRNLPAADRGTREDTPGDFHPICVCLDCQWIFHVANLPPMTSDKRSSDGHGRRSQARLPRVLREELGRVAKTRNRNASQLALEWLDTAMHLALAGRTDLLPAKSSAPSAGEDWANLQYGQTATDAAYYSRVLGDAGSSALAVIAGCALAYIEADGDTTAMGWPARDGLLRGKVAADVAVAAVLSRAA